MNTIDRITGFVDTLARDNGVALLYACESGSRAWGFASPDSDFDVRFLYVRPPDDYLSILDRRDVIEHPVDAVLDIGGWDLRKALRLLLRSNPPLLEWLQSPIVYRTQPGFAAELLSLAEQYFSPRAALHHYTSMAGNALADLQSEQVRLKRYFYALRPLLAAMWTAEHRAVPPMEFAVLREQLSGNAPVDAMIDDLLALKRTSDERTMIAPLPELNTFIDRRLASCRESAQTIAARDADPRPLDEYFRTVIRRTVA